MYGPVDLIRLPGAVKLGYDHCGAAGQSHKETHQQVNQGAGASSYCGQGLLSHKAAHHHGIRRIIKLLEKCPEQDRKEKEQELLPDHAVRDPVVACRMILLKCHIFTLYKIRHAWIPFAVFSECMAIDTSALYLSAADTGRRYD